MLTLLGSMILGVAAAFLMNRLSKMFREKKSLIRKRTVIIGVGITVGNFLAVELPAFLAILLIPVGVAAIVWMCLYWREEGSTFKEALLFFVINFVIAIALNNATSRIHNLIKIRWLTAIFDSLPAVVIVLLLGCLVADLVWFQLFLNNGKIFGEEDDDDEVEDERSGNKREATKRSAAET